MRNFNVKVNGQSYFVEVEEVFGAVSQQPVAAPVAPIAAPAPVAAPAAPVAAPAPVAKAAAPADGVKLIAPMPGTLVGIKVANGATVKKGDIVMVLEAMKMENDIAAPADGIFNAVASKGDGISTGDVLAVIA